MPARVETQVLRTALLLSLVMKQATHQMVADISDSSPRLPFGLLKKHAKQLIRNGLCSKQYQRRILSRLILKWCELLRETPTFQDTREATRLALVRLSRRCPTLLELMSSIEAEQKESESLLLTILRKTMQEVDPEATLPEPEDLVVSTMRSIVLELVRLCDPDGIPRAAAAPRPQAMIDQRIRLVG